MSDELPSSCTAACADQLKRQGASARSLASMLAAAAAAAIALALIAPWLYPCIGASRFSDCMDPKLISGSEVFNPESWCYWGACDWLPSPLEKLVRIAVASIPVTLAGVIGGRTVRSNNLIAGVITAAATIALAAGVVWYLYPWATA